MKTKIKNRYIINFLFVFFYISQLTLHESFVRKQYSI